MSMPCVYIFKLEGQPYYKIGYTSSSVYGRLQSAKTYNPHDVICQYLLPSKDPLALEQNLHHELKVFNMRNEWFRFHERTIDSFLEVNYPNTITNKETIDKFLKEEAIKDMPAYMTAVPKRTRKKRKKQGRPSSVCAVDGCSNPVTKRATYCGPACRQKAFREKRSSLTPTPALLRQGGGLV